MSSVRDLIASYTNNEVSVNETDTSPTINNNNNQVNTEQVRFRLNNELLAKKLDDAIMEHIAKFRDANGQPNEQALDLLNEVNRHIQEIRATIFGVSDE
jgi:hypothetical protein